MTKADYATLRRTRPELLLSWRWDQLSKGCRALIGAMKKSKFIAYRSAAVIRGREDTVEWESLTPSWPEYSQVHDTRVTLDL